MNTVLSALEKDRLAPQTDVRIFLDGPKSVEEEVVTSEVKKVAFKDWGFLSVKVVPSKVNLGLANSFLKNLTNFLSAHDRVIVLEDDNLPSPGFLDYMNQALDLYALHPKVVSVSAYSYFDWTFGPNSYFVNFADTWGWGTWSRAWKAFDANPRLLRSQLRYLNLDQKMDFRGSIPFTRLLEKQILGEVDSWGVSWAANAIVNDLLTLYPKTSLIKMIGFDSEGTHSTNSTPSKYLNRSTGTFSGGLRAIKVKENRLARRKFETFFRL